jgi:hypothetical protein
MKRLLPLLFVMVAIFYCGESEGREWVSFESDDVYQYAYNEDSIAQTGKDKVEVWVRWIKKRDKKLLINGRQKKNSTRNTRVQNNYWKLIAAKGLWTS